MSAFQLGGLHVSIRRFAYVFIHRFAYVSIRRFAYVFIRRFAYVSICSGATGDRSILVSMSKIKALLEAA